MQNIYENRKLRDYKIYANDNDTDVLKIINEEASFTFFKVKINW